MSQKRVILWAAPRSLSTAFERSMMNLKNSKIIHEPYYYPFFFGPERQSKRYSLEVTNPEATYRWASELLQKEYDGMDLVFAKDIAYEIDKKFDIFLEDGFKNFKHTFLIRNPNKTVLSLYRASTNPKITGWDYFDPAYVGFKELFEFFQFVRSHLDPSPVVVDADDLIDNPEGVMQSYCEALGLVYQENMTKWPPGPVPGFDYQSSSCSLAWYEVLFKSSGFLPRKNKSRSQDRSGFDKEDMPAEVVDAVKMSMPHFEALYPFRIHAKNTLSDVQV